MSRILVAGGGGVIGTLLANQLRKKGNLVRVADLAFNGHGLGRYCDEELLLDLRDPGNCLRATAGMDMVYNLAANMGGIGFITAVGAEVMRDNLFINEYVRVSARLYNGMKSMICSSVYVYTVCIQ